MQLREILADLMTQAAEDGTTYEGDLDIPLEHINPAHTARVQIVFHVDHDEKSSDVRPHLDLVRVDLFEPDNPGNPTYDQAPNNPNIPIYPPGSPELN